MTDSRKQLSPLTVTTLVGAALLIGGEAGLRAMGTNAGGTARIGLGIGAVIFVVVWYAILKRRMKNAGA